VGPVGWQERLTSDDAPIATVPRSNGTCRPGCRPAI